MVRSRLRRATTRRPSAGRLPTRAHKRATEAAVCTCGRVGGRRRRVASDLARVPRACASPDARRPVLAPRRPHSRATRAAACASGRPRGEWGQDVSVCAHGTSKRVQSRTRNRPYRAVLVRFCTRDVRACAKSDTWRPIRAVARPLLHTLPYGVCKVGHVTSRNEPFLSACAHGTPTRVQSRTRDRPHGAVLVRLCTRDDCACAKSDT